MRVFFIAGLEIMSLACLFARDAKVQSSRPESSGLIHYDERSFQVRPKTLRQGHSATLSWFVPYAQQVRLEQGAEDGPSSLQCLHLIGVFPSKGSLEVSPQVSTTYVVSCADAKTSCAESISINVK